MNAKCVSSKGHKSKRRNYTRNVTSQCIFDKTDFNLRIFLNDVYVGSSFSKPIYFNYHLFERSEQDCV